MKRSASLITAGVLLTIGIVHAQTGKNADGPGAGPMEGKIRITPIELFPGDLKRLQSHLEMEGACFKFECAGRNKPPRVVLSIFEPGKRDINMSLLLKDTKERSSGEVSVSLRKADDPEGHSTWRIIVNAKQVEGLGEFESTQTTTKTLPRDADGSSGQQIRSVTDFDISDEVPLYCRVRSSRPIRLQGPVDEMARAADFAVVLKLVPGDEK